MSRISYLDENSSPQLKDMYAQIKRTRGYVANIQKSLAHAPEGWKRFAAFGEYVRYHSELPARTRELVILAIARKVEYAWVHHYPHAVKAGVTGEELTQLKTGALANTLTEAEKAAIRYGLEFAGSGNVSDETFARLKQHYSERQITDLTFLAGYFVALGATINAFRIELEPKSVLEAAHPKA